MIQSIVERQLRGRLQMEWRPEGLVAQIVVPNEKYAQPDLFQ